VGIDAGVREATAGHADFHLPSGIDLTPIVGGSLVDTVDDARRRTRGAHRGRRRRHQGGLQRWHRLAERPTRMARYAQGDDRGGFVPSPAG